MRQRKKVVVAGLGEIGKPLLQLVSEFHDAAGIDISPVESITQVEILHICYPFQIKDFLGETARYIELFNPALTIIESTVAVGTTRKIAERTGAAVVNSPVRGKHLRMLSEMRAYSKFIGAIDPGAAEQAVRHFESLGLRTKVLSSPEATELAKLSETTYFGLMIAWAQEIERLCLQSRQSYDEVVSFYEEIKFFPPVKYFPGTIGGHCVLPNIEILRDHFQTLVIDVILTSNQLKIEQQACLDNVHAAV